MTRRRIAIACQGGGSQCAFVAGVLKTLFNADVHRRFRVVGLSGTSGGALTAALAWVGLLRQAQGDPTPIEQRILGCWNDLTAQTPLEVTLDNMCVQLVRLHESGMMPGIAISPSMPLFRLWAKTTELLVGRPEFTDLRALLEKHLDFEDLPTLIESESPVLVLGAADVLEGTFKTFSSVHGEIGIDALLASAAVPNLFPAVEIDGHAYWDGIFSSNPPVTAFVRKASMGECPMPHEIWIVRVNPVSSDKVPVRPSDISDRRNAMAGNLSLQHELKLIEVANLLLRERGLTDEFRARAGFDSDEPIAVRTISMSSDLIQRLDYPSKLSRNPAHIARLIADGVVQAEAFLEALEHGERPMYTPASSLQSGPH